MSPHSLVSENKIGKNLENIFEIKINREKITIKKYQIFKIKLSKLYFEFFKFFISIELLFILFIIWYLQ